MVLPPSPASLKSLEIFLYSCDTEGTTHKEVFIMKKQLGLIFFVLSPFVISSALAAIPMKSAESFSKGPRYNVNMRIGLKGAMPFSINTVARAGKKSSVTEISEDGQTETYVQMTPHKAMRDQKPGLNIDVLVTRTVKGTVKASEKLQIFAFENEESESRMNAQGRGRQDLSIAVLANPI
jgi:hypothetical protein